MIIIMETGASEKVINKVSQRVKELGLEPHISKGALKTVIGVIGDKTKVDTEVLYALKGVAEIIPVSKPYKLVSREFHQDDTILDLGQNVKIGGQQPVVVMAGPCTVENKKSFLEIAKEMKKAGANMLRGGAFKPRTSPYSFQGMGEAGLKIMAEARDLTKLPIVTEVMDTRDVEMVARYADVLQVGARNMQNFNLLKELGKIDKPVLLKRGMSATIEEWLMSGEYICAGGNKKVIFCERGIRTMESYTRNTLDLSAVPVVKKLSHFPVVVDPSHGTGRWDLVIPMAKAAIAAGAHGLLIEAHNDPEHALSDGAQSLKYKTFKELMAKVRKIERALKS